VSENYDGGEAILEAFRNLGVDYIISSPGSEWPPVWEALARQRANEIDGPKYIDCWHESLAVAMAMGYTRYTGRLQAVLLHAGVGPLQGSMSIYGATQGEVPMLVCSGGSITYGEDPEFDPGPQWVRNHGIVGGPSRLIDPLVKWSGQVNSPHTLYETVSRAGELAQRVPKGPAYLHVPLEIMLEKWPMPDKAAKVAPQPKTQPDPADVARIARLIAASKRPIIVSETSGEDTTAFAALQELADLASIPVVEPGTPTYANFPNNHPLHMGFDIKPHVETCDLFLVVGSSVPWYPPHAGPTNGTVVVIDENPIKGYMTYQNLQADHYLEGNIASSLRLLIEALKAQDPGESSVLQDRRQHWESEHNRIFDGYRSAAAAVKDERPIDPVWLCAAISDVMPENAIYVEETITHRQPIQRHISWSQAQSYFHPSGGLGMGLGQALGVKLAAPERPVLALVGDGSFLYNPIVPALGAAKEIGLPILIVVFNNGNYSAMKGSHLDFYPQGVAANTGIFHGVNISGPDYSTLIQPFGGYGERVEDPAEVKPALERALAAVSSGQTALLDVVLSR